MAILRLVDAKSFHTAATSQNKYVTLLLVTRWRTWFQNGWCRGGLVTKDLMYNKSQ